MAHRRPVGVKLTLTETPLVEVGLLDEHTSLVALTLEDLEFVAGVEAFQRFVFDVSANEGACLAAGSELIARRVGEDVALRGYDLHSDRVVLGYVKWKTWQLTLERWAWERVRDDITRRANGS